MSVRRSILSLTSSAIEAADRRPDAGINPTNPDAPASTDWSYAVRSRTAHRCALHDPAVLRARVQAEGADVPAGAAGTVALVASDGRARVAEFFAPLRAVVTVPEAMLAQLGA
jgi:hypothetical protein